MRSSLDQGWLKGPNQGVSAINILIRKGNPGFNTVEADRTFQFREEAEWPLPNTNQTKFYLSSDLKLSTQKADKNDSQLEYEALTGEPFSFSTSRFEQVTEITGHITANLVMGVKGIRECYMSSSY